MISTALCGLLLCAPAALAQSDSGEQKAIKRLSERDATAWVDGSKAHYAIRAEGEHDQVMVISGVQGDLERIDGTDVWYGAFEIERIEEAVMGVRFVYKDDGAYESGPTLAPLRGPKAPTAPEEADPLRGTIETLELGEELLGSPREVKLYLPPGVPAEDIERILVMTDGGGIDRYAPVVEPLITGGAIPPTAIVGVASGGMDFTVPGPAGDRRGIEYLPGFTEMAEGADPALFDRHWEFFVEWLPSWLERERGLSGRRTLFGVSNGAVFCGHAAAKRPDLFADAILCSPAWEKTGEAFTPIDSDQSIYVSGGILEPSFLAQAREIHTGAKAAGRRVKLVEVVGGHDAVVWVDQLVAGLLWLEGVREPGE